MAKTVYDALDRSREFSLKDQMTRAAVSIPSNIAEGYERSTNKDFVRFLRIAQGSAAELRTQAYIANSTGLVDKEAADHIVQECKQIGAMLQGLAKARSNDVSETNDFFDDAGSFPEPFNPKAET